MNDKLLSFSQKPILYETSTAKFWDDEHISKGMLEAHLNPVWDAATRNHEFVRKSIQWISDALPPAEFPMLLDLGCGPGLYAEGFHQLGYSVTGVDLSKRSIDYARESAMAKGFNINYMLQDYLSFNFREKFDVITMIYCDFGVLSDSSRKELLRNIYHALTPNGAFIVDVFTPKQHENKLESTEWVYSEGGFWCKDPHICMNAFYRYDEASTVLDQTIVITNEAIKCYNIWEHTFTPDQLKRELAEAGFSSIHLYNDIAGAAYTDNNATLCAVAK